MKRYKIVAIVLSIVMCLSMLTGCDFLPPKTAVDLVQRSSKVMSELDNYRMSMEMNVDASITGNVEGVEMDMLVPIEFTLEMNRSGDYVAGDMDMDASVDAMVSFMGQTETMSESMKKSSRLHMDIANGVMYTKDDDEAWVCDDELDDDAFDMQGLLDSNAENNMFANATMEKNDTEYVVTLKFADVLANENFVDFISENMSNDMDVDWDEFADAIGDADISYRFDAKTYRMISFETSDIVIDDIDFISDMPGLDLSGINADGISMIMNICVEFDKFGEVDADDVQIPDDVIDSAVDKEDIDAESDADESGVVGTEPVVEPEIENGNSNDGDAADSVVTGDIRFVYGDSELNIPTDYQVFLDDGWYPVDDGMYGSFLCMMNEKYGYTTLYLYTNDGSGTEASVKENGADGFSVTTDESGKYPALSLCGVTFGDDISSLKAVLGEPDTTQSYSDTYGTYETYEWQIDYDGIECMLTISVWNGVISEMSISYWG